MPEAVFQPLSSYVEYTVDEMRRRATVFREQMQRRR
ncbi:nitroreductase family protein, partial [bacterium]|nr:nitroreductase family protein [bacterium]